LQNGEIAKLRRRHFAISPFRHFAISPDIVLAPIAH